MIRYIKKFKEESDEEKLKSFHDHAVKALKDFYNHAKSVYGEKNMEGPIYLILKESLPKDLYLKF